MKQHYTKETVSAVLNLAKANAFIIGLAILICSVWGTAPPNLITTVWVASTVWLLFCEYITWATAE